MDGNRRTVLVVNRRALRLSSESSPLLADYRRLAERGVLVRETWEEPALRSAFEELAIGGDDTVLFAGGDGSVRGGLSALVATSVERPLPIVGFLPGGTVGTIARHFAKRRRILDRALGGGPIAVVHAPTLQVDADDGPPQVGFIFGAGLVARFFRRYYAAGTTTKLGKRTAAQLVARIFASSFVNGTVAREVLSPVPATLTIDGRRAEGDAWSLIVASVLPDLGLHLRVTYAGGRDPERPIHLVASSRGPRELGPELLRVVRGAKLKEPVVDVAPSSSVELAFGDDDAFVLDGDVFATRRVRLTNGPVFRVVAR